MALGLAQPAFAQGADDPATASSSSDIIVTARRIEERLQDVPISISVLNQTELNNRNLSNTGDLAAYVPSLGLDQRFGTEQASFSIRGFFQDLGSAPTVGVYFADAVAPRGSTAQTTAGDGVGPGVMFDLENVQVLKGPQGTLLGRNTTGGAILFVPHRPTPKFEGYMEGSYGNYDMFRVQGVVNLPITSSIKLRLGFDKMSRDGYLKNVSDNGPYDFANTDYFSGRASLLIDVTPNLENYTIGTYSRSESNGALPKVIDCNKDPNSGLGPILGLLNVCNAQLARAAGKGFYAVENGYPYKPETYIKQWQVINSTTWHATDNITVKNIFSYGEFVNRYAMNVFGDAFYFNSNAPAFQPPSPAAALKPLIQAVEGQGFTFAQSNPTPGFNTSDQKTLTNELRVQGRSFDNRLDWQTGFYLEHSDPIHPVSGLPSSGIPCLDINSLQCFDVLGIVTQGGFSGGVQRSVTEVSFRNYGLYTQGTFALTDQLKITAGLRYTWDEVKSKAQLINYSFPAPFTPSPSCFFPAPLSSGNPSDAVNGCISTAKVNSSAPTWVIDLEYAPNADMMLYAKYARGYRQGGVNARSFVPSFGPEKVDSYEAGLKASFSAGDVAGNVDLAGFYNGLSNQQILASFLLDIPGSPPQQAIVNVGKSRMYGFEASSSLRFFHRFMLDASAAYIDSKITDVAEAGNVLALVPPALQANVTQITTAATVGQPIPITPKFRITLTGTLNLPVPDTWGDLSVAATFTHTDRLYVTSADGYSGPLLPDANHTPATDLTNLNLNWNSVGRQPIDLSFFVTNVFDKKYVAATVGGWNSLGFKSVLLGQPRMYGLRLRLSFGQ
jgi:iron complex outermembrane receptor protein